VVYVEIEHNQLKFYGHVQRMVEEILPKKAFKWMPKEREHEEGFVFVPPLPQL
jgi:hypothetical protein